MARRTYMLEGVEYRTQDAFKTAYLEAFRQLDFGDAYEPDDLIDDVMRASPWVPDEWIEQLSIYRVMPGTDDPRFPHRKADQLSVWIKLLDGTVIRLGNKGIMQTRHGAFSSWMREAVEEDTRALHAEYRTAGGFTCAADGVWHKGTHDLNIDHEYEFAAMLREFLAEYTGKEGATVEGIEFAHPDDEVPIKTAFLRYHRKLARLQPMCRKHNSEKEANRRKNLT